MGISTAIIGAVGALSSAAGSIMGAEAQGQAANYQAAIARNNAIVNQYASVNATNAAQQQAQTDSIRNAARLAGIKASMAASGVDVNSGSAEDVQQSQRQIGYLGTENVAQAGEMKAYGYQVAASNDMAQSQLDQFEASQAPIAGILGATGSLLGSAKSIYGGFGNTTTTNATVDK